MKFFGFFPLFFLLCFWAEAQSRYSGNVLDAWDKKYLEGVHVSIKGKEATSTNSRGYFNIPASIGDTLKLSFPGFLEKEVVLTQERFLQLEIHDRARLLPTFQVEAEPYRFRFKDGKLYLAEDEPETKSSLTKSVGIAPLDSSSPGGGIAVYGVISQFTRRNRQLRAYEKKLEWESRRAGYLEVIDSDTLRTELMEQYNLDRLSWDQMVIRFNEFHQNHEFLDWPKEKVLSSLKEFIRLESDFLD
jgi:hypothetical protein